MLLNPEILLALLSSRVYSSAESGRGTKLFTHQRKTAGQVFICKQWFCATIHNVPTCGLFLRSFHPQLSDKLIYAGYLCVANKHPIDHRQVFHRKVVCDKDSREVLELWDGY
jgi:hypothetical protein